MTMSHTSKYQHFDLLSLKVDRKTFFFPLLYLTVILFAQLFVTFTVCVFVELIFFWFFCSFLGVPTQSDVETKQAFCPSLVFDVRSSEVPRLISEVSATQEEGASQL